MKNYTIHIKEESYFSVTVQAASQEEAVSKVEADYWKDPNAFILEPHETAFECVGEEDT